MFLETIKALIARFANYDSLTEQPHSSGAATDSTAVGSGSSTITGTYASNEPERNGQLALSMLAPALFSHAHDFVINNPILISHVINSSAMVLQLLGQKRIPGAEVDSSARDPPPKCHPDTRKTLRGRITGWLSKANRDWRMLWVIGPMGVGKSAIAQTIAEETKETGQLGAALFFSRSNHRDDPDGVIPTLAYQLAVKSPEYKHIIAQRLVDNPTILEKNRRTQFKELIIEPFQILMAQRAQIVQTPLLIILDGLDECRSKEAQCEFIELISDHVRQVDQFPLLWMICSRPEWHLKGLLSHPDFHVTCRREEMVIDDVEAEEDVTLVLKEGFRDIYHKYRDYLEPGWPLEADFRYVSTSASGHFAFASTILKYVGDQQHANPRAQLNACVRFLGGSGVPGAMNPLHALDLLYRQVLSDVPEEIVETTMRILGQIVLYWYYPLTALSQANFLCIDQPTFYRSLQHLHSVLNIPSSADASRHELRFHHTSFQDFLLEPYRSGSFAVNEAAVHYDIATHSLKWQSSLTDTTEEEFGEKSNVPVPSLNQPLNILKKGVQSTNPMLAWVHPEVTEEKVLAYLKTYSLRACWEACRFVDEKDLPNFIPQLKHFDFRRLEHLDQQHIAASFPWLFKTANRFGAKPFMHQVTPDNTTIRNLTQAHKVEYLVDNLEEHLADFGPHLNIPPQTSEGAVILSFQFGDGDDALELEVKAKPWRAQVSYTAGQSDEISFSKGEVVHVIRRTPDDRWYVKKVDGTEGFVSSEYFVGKMEVKYVIRALSHYVASPDRPNEVSFREGEIINVIDDSEDWWEVRKSDGTNGVAPSKVLASSVSWKYKARALYDRTASPFHTYDISFKKGEIVDVMAFQSCSELGWWVVKKADGTIGDVPSNYFILVEA